MFIALEFGQNTILNEATSPNFRHPLEQHNLIGAAFKAIKYFL